MRSVQSRVKWELGLRGISVLLHTHEGEKKTTKKDFPLRRAAVDDGVVKFVGSFQFSIQARKRVPFINILLFNCASLCVF